MHFAGVRDYEAFARGILEIVTDRPISFEVFADDFDEMERQARKIAAWAENVVVKIPVMNTRHQSSVELVHVLAHSGVKVNVTAVMTLEQIRGSVSALAGGAPATVSLFAGRVADTGRDPIPMVAAAAAIAGSQPNVELIWASPRELLNIFQADAAGCHIITVDEKILTKLESVGKDLDAFSLETVQMFHKHASASGYRL
jgi:transaldolase